MDKDIVLKNMKENLTFKFNKEIETINDKINALQKIETVENLLNNNNYNIKSQCPSCYGLKDIEWCDTNKCYVCWKEAIN